MHGDSFLAVPVAAVHDGWLATDFFPAVDSVIHTSRTTGGILWLPSDSGAEGDYLLSQMAQRCQAQTFPFEELTVNPIDPLQFWRDFSGSCEVAGLFASRQSRVLLIRGGELLPVSSIAVHLPILNLLSQASILTVVLPLFRSQVGALQALAPGFTRLSIPSLADAPVPRQQALVEALVSTRVPGLGLADRQAFVAVLFKARPASRAQLESWLDVYSDSDDPLEQLRRMPPPLPSDPRHEPPPVITHHYLRDRFARVIERLGEANRAFQALWGQPLLFNHQPLKDPFASAEPDDWLFALVSHLSCLVFDAGKNALEPLTDYSFDAVVGDIIGQPSSDFVPNLRRLRTLFQHAMSLENERNRQNLELVASWYERHSVPRSPGPEYARVLADALLGESEKVVISVHDVVVNLSRAPSAKVVRQRLEIASRNIEQGELLQYIEDAIRYIDPGVDLERVKKKYEQEIRNNLKTSCLKGPKLETYARQLVEEAVAKESRLCPIDGDWLMGEGIQPGMEMGAWRNRFRQEWEKQPPHMTPKVFQAEARRQLAEHRRILSTENRKRWRESGQAKVWVESHNGQWSHADWLSLLKCLRDSLFWPMVPDEVGAVLEEIKTGNSCRVIQQ